MTKSPVEAEENATFSRRSYAQRFKAWAAIGFWICVGFAVLFAIVFIVGFIGDVLEFAVSYAGERILPVAFREFMIWFADDALPQMAPALSWMDSFGAAWGGLLTLASFLLAVMSIVLAIALSGKAARKT
jgi:hypothetical protein